MQKINSTRATIYQISEFIFGLIKGNGIFSIENKIRVYKR